LLLLSLLENACKHSTREELNQAKVLIELSAVDSGIDVQISNSKPQNVSFDNGQDKVGLINLRKQLALLYPNAHRFEIVNDKHRYEVKLFLTTVRDS